MTHTYIQAIKQPTLHCLTRSVRRRAATSKRTYRKSEVMVRQMSETLFVADAKRQGYGNKFDEASV